MANYSVQLSAVSGIVKTAAGTFHIVEVAVGGRVLRDLWENPASPPVGVTIPTNWSVRCLDTSAILIVSGTPQFDDETVYLAQVVDGDQTGSDYTPTLDAWASALEAAENP
jgi:hypothetical protein